MAGGAAGGVGGDQAKLTRRDEPLYRAHSSTAMFSIFSDRCSMRASSHLSSETAHRLLPGHRTSYRQPARLGS